MNACKDLTDMQVNGDNLLIVERCPPSRLEHSTWTAERLATIPAKSSLSPAESDVLASLRTSLLRRYLPDWALNEGRWGFQKAIEWHQAGRSVEEIADALETVKAQQKREELRGGAAEEADEDDCDVPVFHGSDRVAVQKWIDAWERSMALGYVLAGRTQQEAADAVLRDQSTISRWWESYRYAASAYLARDELNEIHDHDAAITHNITRPKIGKDRVFAYEFAVSKATSGTERRRIRPPRSLEDRKTGGRPSKAVYSGRDCPVCAVLAAYTKNGKLRIGWENLVRSWDTGGRLG